MEEQYLTMTSIEDGSLIGVVSAVSQILYAYPSEGELEWNDLANGLALNKGEKIYVKTDTVSTSADNMNKFTITGKIILSGNILSMGNVGQQSHIKMFEDCKGIVEANVIMPNSTMLMCYVALFKGCTNMIKAPKLPATTLTPMCYAQMFESCESLEESFELPATTLATGCYTRMFTYSGVKKITLWKAPLAQATTANLAGIINNSYITEIHLSNEGKHISGDYKANKNLIISNAASIKNVNVKQIINSNNVERCKANTYTTSYSSPTNNNTYACGNSLNGGWNIVG